jgi:hypothetical protein
MNRSRLDLRTQSVQFGSFLCLSLSQNRSTIKSREKFCGIYLLRIRKQAHKILGTNFMRAPENKRVDRYVLYHYRERRLPSVCLHEFNRSRIARRVYTFPTVFISYRYNLLFHTQTHRFVLYIYIVLSSHENILYFVTYSKSKSIPNRPTGFQF